MKKLLLTIIAGFTLLQMHAQNWKASNLTAVTYLPISSTESHKGDLFSSVANGIGGDLYKLNSNETSWTKIKLDSVAYPKFLKHADTRLYLSSVVSGVISMLYYSIDGGQTFKPDTAGLPHPYAPTYKEVSLIYGIQYAEGKVILNLGAAGYYIKDTTATKWKSINPSTALNGGVDPLTYYNGTVYAYDNTGTHTFYKSIDNGTTWTVVTTNLPSDYATNLLVADKTNGRLYSFGNWSSATIYGLRYSDDGGVTWNTHDLSAFLKKNANNTQQLIKSIYAEGNVVYLGLENNKASTAPDLIGTVSGINNLAYDTLGFPTNGAAGLYPFYILKHKNKLVTSLVTTDVYLKDLPVGINDQATNNSLNLYPNPANEVLNIQFGKLQNAGTATVMDLTGRIVLSKQINAQQNSIQLNIAGLTSGVYHVTIVSGTSSESYRFVKN